MAFKLHFALFLCCIPCIQAYIRDICKHVKLNATIQKHGVFTIFGGQNGGIYERVYNLYNRWLTSQRLDHCMHKGRKPTLYNYTSLFNEAHGT